MAALKYLAKRGYVHRDVSAGNIILYNGRAKLSDLEFAQEYGPGKSPYAATVNVFRNLADGPSRLFPGNELLHGRRGSSRQVHAPSGLQAFCAQYHPRPRVALVDRGLVHDVTLPRPGRRRIRPFEARARRPHDSARDEALPAIQPTRQRRRT